jgi:hypothetical protein
VVFDCDFVESIEHYDTPTTPEGALKPVSCHSTSEPVDLREQFGDGDIGIAHDRLDVVSEVEKKRQRPLAAASLA